MTYLELLEIYHNKLRFMWDLEVGIRTGTIQVYFARETDGD